MMADRAAWTRHLRIHGELVAPKSKYHAKPQEVDGIWFASGKEARRYQELVTLARFGLIGDLERQPMYRLEVVALHAAKLGEVVTCGHYTADFRYVDTLTGATVIEDVKSSSTRTTAYRLRKRLVEAIHGVTITEV